MSKNIDMCFSEFPGMAGHIRVKKGDMVLKEAV